MTADLNDFDWLVLAYSQRNFEMVATEAAKLITPELVPRKRVATAVKVIQKGLKPFRVYKLMLKSGESPTKQNVWNANRKLRAAGLMTSRDPENKRGFPNNHSLLTDAGRMRLFIEDWFRGGSLWPDSEEKDFAEELVLGRLLGTTRESHTAAA